MRNLADTQPSTLALILSYWWVLFLLAPFAEGIAEWFGGGLRSWLKVRHKRKLELIKARAKAGRIANNAPPAAAPVPGECRHRQAVPVRDNTGTVVAWLCTSCDTQLPKTFSVHVEDL